MKSSVDLANPPPRAYHDRVALTLLFTLIIGSSPVQLAAEEQAYALAWRFVTGGRIVTKPAVDHHGTIYLLSDDRTLYALSPLGQERWRFFTGSKVSSGPVITYDGTVLVGTLSGTLIAVSAGGRRRWSFTPGSGACLAPALAFDGSILLPTSGGTIYSLTYMGQERWRYQLRAELASGPSIDREGIAYVGTTDRRLLALNRDGTRKWELTLPDRVGTPAVAADGSLYVSAAGLHRVSAEGALLWSYAVPAQTADPVLRADGALIAGANNGRLYALSPEGEQLWSASLRSPIRLPAVIGDDGMIYVATDSTSLVAVSGQGRVFWRFYAKQTVRYPAIGKDGTVLIGAEDWILYALKAGSKGLAAGSWPQAYHDSQHTGRAGALSDLDGPAALLLRELAAAKSPELKRMALQQIEAHFQGKRYLAVHLLTLEQVLGYLAGEGVLYRSSQSDLLSPRYPEIRLEACRLLGELGSEGARAALLQITLAEDDTIVRTAALESLSRIGFDPDGELARAILYSIETRTEERYLLACAAALYRLVISSAGAVHPDNYRALAALAGIAAYLSVRERAAGYLRELSRRRER